GRQVDDPRPSEGKHHAERDPGDDDAGAEAQQDVQQYFFHCGHSLTMVGEGSKSFVRTDRCFALVRLAARPIGADAAPRRGAGWFPSSRRGRCQSVLSPGDQEEGVTGWSQPATFVNTFLPMYS